MFIRGIKSNISLVFLTQSYFALPKTIRLNSVHCFILKIPNKREFQQISFSYSSDVDFKDAMNLYTNVLQNHILFWLLMLLLQLIIVYVLEKIFWKKYKNWSWQLMIRLELKKYNMMATEKQQKHQQYHLEKYE